MHTKYTMRVWISGKKTKSRHMGWNWFFFSSLSAHLTRILYANQHSVDFLASTVYKTWNHQLHTGHPSIWPVMEFPKISGPNKIIPVNVLHHYIYPTVPQQILKFKRSMMLFPLPVFLYVCHSNQTWHTNKSCTLNITVRRLSGQYWNFTAPEFKKQNNKTKALLVR